jgi:hypothetical protein
LLSGGFGGRCLGEAALGESKRAVGAPAHGRDVIGLYAFDARFAELAENG